MTSVSDAISFAKSALIVELNVKHQKVKVADSDCLNHHRYQSSRSPHLIHLPLHLLLEFHDCIAKLLNLVLRLRSTYQHNTLWHNYVCNLKTTECHYLAKLWTAAEDASDDLRIDDGAEGKVDLAEVRILLCAIECVSKGSVRDVAARRYVKIFQTGSRVCHKRLEPTGREADRIVFRALWISVI